MGDSALFALIPAGLYAFPGPGISINQPVKNFAVNIKMQII